MGGTGNTEKDKRIADNAAHGKNIKDAWSVILFDEEKLRAMTNPELAGWPWESGVENPARIKLADFEWQRRVLAEQTKSVRLAAIIGVLAAIAGGIAGSVLTVILGEVVRNNCH